MTPEQIAALPYRRNVGIMLIDRRGYVFVGQRRDNHSDAWQMPQGGIDPGELPILQNRKVEGKTLIYVCQSGACKLTVLDINEALEPLD